MKNNEPTTRKLHKTYSIVFQENYLLSLNQHWHEYSSNFHRSRESILRFVEPTFQTV